MDSELFELLGEALELELLLEFLELALGVQGEGALLDPGEVGRVRFEHLAGGLALVLAEVNDRLSVGVPDKVPEKST